jgi:hypothetical protein
MNDRLKDLMVQAGYAAPELAGRANKLAELIVRECASLAYDGPGGILDHFGLQEHFGVEE